MQSALKFHQWMQCLVVVLLIAVSPAVAQEQDVGYAWKAVTISFQNASDVDERGISVMFDTSIPTTDGTIVVSTNLAESTFLITGAATYSGVGTTFTIPAVPEGTYTITYGDVDGYLTPSPEVQTLSAGNVLSFYGTYDAITPDTPQLHSSSSLLDFPSQKIGSTSGPRNITLSNIGTGILSINAISLEGSNSSDFSIQNATCMDAYLTPGNACSVSMVFSPKELGIRTAALNVASNIIGSPTIIALEGTGVALVGEVRPSVRSISPNSGPAGTSVVIRGSVFGDLQASGYVKFGNTTAETTSWSKNAITAIVPSEPTGSVPVVVVTAAGESNADKTYEYPEMIWLNLAGIPAIKERQDFGFLKRTSTQPQFALLSVASDQWQSFGDDECYSGAMSAVAITQKKKIVEESVQQLTAGVIKASLGAITTGSTTGDFILRIGFEAGSSLYQKQPVGRNLAIALTNEIGGYAVSRIASDYLRGAGSLLTDITQQSISNALDNEGVLSWTLSGSNANSQFVNSGGPLTSVSVKAYYNPWTHYTAAITKASCALSTGTQERVYLLKYEQSKSTFGGAEPIYPTISHKVLLF